MRLPAGWEGKGVEGWARELGVPHLELAPVLSSTSDRLRELAREGAPALTVVIAGAQTRGRGRSGRGWHSPGGSGLWISVLLGRGGASYSGVLPLAVGVAAARAVERFFSGAVALKWPNDLLLGADKVGGILCETTGDPFEGVVAGIGINLRRPEEGMPAELSKGVAFLEEAAGRPIHEPALAGVLLRELERWTVPVPGTLEGRLLREWESRDCLRGRRVEVESGVRGRTLGVAADGALELEGNPGERVQVRSGGVRLDEEGGSPALHAFPESHHREEGA